MSVGTFPKVIYRNTIVGGYFSIQGGDEKYTFHAGDILIAGIKKNFDDEEYLLTKTVVVDSEGTDILIRFTAEETANIPSDTYGWLEIKLISVDGQIKEPVYQEKIYMGGVIVDE